MTDASLDFVARRLRLLGFDITSVGEAPLERVLEQARREDRVVLKLSARHPRRFADVACCTVPRDASVAVRTIAERYRPAGPPFSRCSVCNAVLETFTKEEARGHVPEALCISAATFDHCATCGRWYWPGSHVERMRAWLEAALGRSLGTPRDPSSHPSLGARETGC